MDLYKIDNHFKEYGDLLAFWTFSNELSTFVKSSLMEELNIESDFDSAFKNIYNSLENIINIETLNIDLGFENIMTFLSDLNLNNDDQFFLIWDFSENVDVFSINTFKKYWSSIWYGDSDESLILYIPNKVIVLLNDWGEVRVSSLVLK